MNHGETINLTGRRILVVEDTSIVAVEIAGLLKRFGCRVLGPVARVKDALELIRTEDIDAVLLDVNLSGDMSFDVAEELLARGIPFLFLTGYGVEGLPEAFRECPRLTKPFGISEFREAIGRLLQDDAAIHCDT